MMDSGFMKPILVFDNFEFYDIFRNQAIWTNWGIQGQSGHFDNFIVNYDKHAYLGLIGAIGSEN